MSAVNQTTAYSTELAIPLFKSVSICFCLDGKQRDQRIVTTYPNIQGDFIPEFGGVADAFAQNFETRGEVGASLCIYRHGQCVADLWGGKADAEKDINWSEDTVSIVYSCTKAMTALCAHLLIDRGELNLHAPVGDYWPEYACNGKEKTTVAMFLNHTAGMASLTSPVKDGGLTDWDYTVELMAKDPPWWVPGTRNGYHMLTFGWTVGELVRRVSGMSLGEFFRKELAEPLDADFWIGLPEAIDKRVAPVLAYKPAPGETLPPFTRVMLSEPESLQAACMKNNGRLNFNKASTHRAEIGGAGGISNARGMAKVFAALSPSHPDEMFSPARVSAMGNVSAATMEDATLLIPTRFGQGFMCSMDNRHVRGGQDCSFIIGRNAFGHVGMGGSCVFFDPEADLVFAYSMNKMGGGILLNDRGQSLIDATYETLGYSGNPAGFWAP